jgi:hypothetical protein
MPDDAVSDPLPEASPLAAALETPSEPQLPTGRHTTALSRGLVIAFVLVLCFIGWLGVVGIGDAAGQGLFGLFDPGAGGCGGG